MGHLLRECILMTVPGREVAMAASTGVQACRLTSRMMSKGTSIHLAGGSPACGCEGQLGSNCRMRCFTQAWGGLWLRLTLIQT